MSKFIGKILLWLLGHVLVNEIAIFHLSFKLKASAWKVVAPLERQHKDRSGELKRDKAYKALHRLHPEIPKRQLSVAIEWAVERLKGVSIS